MSTSTPQSTPPVSNDDDDGDDDVSGPVMQKRKRIGDEDLDLTPMIDVTFQLLIFFMVASNMSSKPKVDLPQVRHSISVEGGAATFITIRAKDSDTPVALLGDGAGPEGTPEDIKKYVGDAVNEKRTKVILKGDGDAPIGFVDEVCRAIRSVDGAELYFAVADPPR